MAFGDLTDALTKPTVSLDGVVVQDQRFATDLLASSRARRMPARQIAGRSRYALMYGPLLYAAVGSKDLVLRIEGSRAEDIAKQLKPKPDAPLRFSVTGNPGITYAYAPYLQISGDEEFTCFPAFDFLSEKMQRVECDMPAILSIS
jgi:hypothetical protein